MSADRRRSLAVLAAGLVLIAAAWLAVVPPLRHARELDRRIAAARAQAAQRAAVAPGTTSPSAAPQHAADARRLRDAVPVTARVGTLIRALDAEARHAGARLVDTDTAAGGPPAPAAPAASATDGAPAALPPGAVATAATLPGLSLTLGYTGSFRALQRVVHRVATHVKDADGRLEATGRLVSIQALQLSRDSRDHLRATVAATAYVAPPAAGSAAP